MRLRFRRVVCELNHHIARLVDGAFIVLYGIDMAYRDISTIRFADLDILEPEPLRRARRRRFG